MQDAGRALAACGFEPTACEPSNLAAAMHLHEPAAALLALPDGGGAFAVPGPLRGVPVVVLLPGPDAGLRSLCLEAGAADVAATAPEAAEHVAALVDGWQRSPHRIPWERSCLARAGSDDLDLRVVELGVDGLSLRGAAGLRTGELVEVDLSLPEGVLEARGRACMDAETPFVRFLGLFEPEAAALNGIVEAARREADAPPAADPAPATAGPAASAPAAPTWPPVFDIDATAALLQNAHAPATSGEGRSTPPPALVAGFLDGLPPKEHAWLGPSPHDEATAALARRALAARLCLGACTRAARVAPGVQRPRVDAGALHGTVARAEALLDELLRHRAAQLVASASGSPTPDLGGLRNALAQALADLRTAASRLGAAEPAAAQPAVPVDLPAPAPAVAASREAPPAEPAKRPPAVPSPAAWRPPPRPVDPVVREARRRAVFACSAITVLAAVAVFLLPDRPKRLGPEAFEGMRGIVGVTVREGAATVDVSDEWAGTPEDARRIAEVLAAQGVSKAVVVDVVGRLRAVGSTSAPLHVVAARPAGPTRRPRSR